MNNLLISIIIIIIILIILTYWIYTIIKTKGGHGKYICIDKTLGNDGENDIIFIHNNNNYDTIFNKKSWSFGSTSNDTIFKLLFKNWIDSKKDKSLNAKDINIYLLKFLLLSRFDNYTELSEKINKVWNINVENLCDEFKNYNNFKNPLINLLSDDNKDIYKMWYIVFNNTYTNGTIFENNDIKITYDKNNKQLTFISKIENKSIIIDSKYISKKNKFNNKFDKQKFIKLVSNEIDQKINLIDVINQINTNYYKKYIYDNYEDTYRKIINNTNISSIGILKNLYKECENNKQNSTKIKFKNICLNELSSGTGINGYDNILKGIHMFNIDFDILITFEINESYQNYHWTKSLISDIRNMITIYKYLIKDNNYKCGNKKYGSFQICCDTKNNSHKLYSKSYCWSDELSKKLKKATVGIFKNDLNELNKYFDEFHKNINDSEVNTYTVYILNAITEDDFKDRDCKSFEISIDGIKELINFYITNNSNITLKQSYSTLFAQIIKYCNFDLIYTDKKFNVISNNSFKGGNLDDILKIFDNTDLCNNPDGIAFI